MKTLFALILCVFVIVCSLRQFLPEPSPVAVQVPAQTEDERRYQAARELHALIVTPDNDPKRNAEIAEAIEAWKAKYPDLAQNIEDNAAAKKQAEEQKAKKKAKKK